MLYTALAAFGAGVIGTIIGTAFGHGSPGMLLGTLAGCSLLVGLAAGGSATSRILGVSFLGTAIGLGGYLFLAVFLFVSLFGSPEGGVGVGSGRPRSTPGSR